MSPILGIYASQISGHLWPASSYESIQTVTVGAGGASSVDFTSIPSTYSHLQIRVLSADDRGTYYSANNIRFNGDTGSNYVQHQLYGTGSSAGSAYTAASTSLECMESVGSSSGSAFAVSVMDILDYANTNKNKTIRVLSGRDNNTNGQIDLFSGLWLSTSAISSITIRNAATNFRQYSSFALYGIKVAA